MFKNDEKITNIKERDIIALWETISTFLNNFMSVTV